MSINPFAVIASVNCKLNTYLINNFHFCFFNPDLQTWSLLKDNPLLLFTSWTRRTHTHIYAKTRHSSFVKLQSLFIFPVATSMANSTTTAIKILTAPGPAGRSSPEGSQVSPFLITKLKNICIYPH